MLSRLKIFTCLIIFMVGLSTLLSAKPVQIVTICEDFESIAKSIGGDLVSTTALIKGSRNLHHINPKPSMVMKVKKADLIIRLGMKQDVWIDGLIQVARNAKIFPGQPGYLDASKSISKLEVPDHDIDGRHGDMHIAGNPHYWLSPLNGVVIAKDIATHLSEIDPTNKATYEANLAQFEKEINAKMQEWRKRLKPYQTHAIITYHKVWSYFFDAFNLRVLGELESLPGIPPTVAHLYKLQEDLANEKISPLIITAVYYPQKVGKRFAKRINGRAISLSANVGHDGITSYTGLFDDIISRIEK